MSKVHPLAALVANLFFPELLGTSREVASSSEFPEVGETPAILSWTKRKGGVAMMLGRRESGKTILAQRLAEVIGRPTYCVSPEQNPPDWITELKFDQLDVLPPPRSTLILDDLPVYMSNRDYMNPLVRTVEQLIPVVRHRRKIFLIFSSQSSALSDKFTLDADLVFLKPVNLLFEDLERAAVAKLYKKIQPVFQQRGESFGKRHAYLLCQNWKGFVNISMTNTELPGATR